MAHTIKVILGGLVLLALCILIGRANGAKLFIPLWLLGAGINMWIGVTRAGYSVAEEAPIFLLVFAVPAAMALLVLWRMS
jgi:hypothetical protein